MGYTTDFRGMFNLDKKLRPEHNAYLHAFSDIRHMKRDVKQLRKLKDPLRTAVNLGLGVDGEFFIGTGGLAGEQLESVLENNNPGGTQPGLWCSWVPTEEEDGIEWNYAEKFYDYTEWMQYIIDKFIKRWGYVLNGEVEWRGEEWEDTGTIIVTDNVMNVNY